MKEIYLDNAATTKVCKEVAEKVYDVMTNFYGNPSSRHSRGLEASKIIFDARNLVANTISAEPENVIFTSGGTESNNLAILGSVDLKFSKNKNIITSAVEHSSVMENIKKLESIGFKVYYVKPNFNGDIVPEDVWNLVDKDTVLVSIMHVNNETGNIYDVKQIAKGVRHKNKNTIIHSDGVQAFGKMKVNVINLDVDLYSFSGHKIYAPKGIGGLYIKKGVKIKPVIIGGHQEFGYRCGTENVAGIAGLGKACELINLEEDLKYIKKLNTLLISELSQINNVHINSVGSLLPYVLNFSIVGQKSEIILNKLQEKNIFISNGSACSKGEKSKALKGMGLEDKYIDSAIRVSLSKYNTYNDIVDFNAQIKYLAGHM